MDRGKEVILILVDCREGRWRNLDRDRDREGGAVTTTKAFILTHKCLGNTSHSIPHHNMMKNVIRFVITLQKLKKKEYYAVKKQKKQLDLHLSLQTLQTFTI